MLDLFTQITSSFYSSLMRPLSLIRPCSKTGPHDKLYTKKTLDHPLHKYSPLIHQKHMCPIHVINFNSQPSAHIYIEIDISYVDNLVREIESVGYLNLITNINNKSMWSWFYSNPILILTNLKTRDMIVWQEKGYATGIRMR